MQVNTTLIFNGMPHFTVANPHPLGVGGYVNSISDVLDCVSDYIIYLIQQ